MLYFEKKKYLTLLIKKYRWCRWLLKVLHVNYDRFNPFNLNEALRLHSIEWKLLKCQDLLLYKQRKEVPYPIVPQLLTQLIGYEGWDFPKNQN